jgi:hypothetical protein
LAKIVFRDKKHDFRQNPIGKLRISHPTVAKIGCLRIITAESSFITANSENFPTPSHENWVFVDYTSKIGCLRIITAKSTYVVIENFPTPNRENRVFADYVAHWMLAAQRMLAAQQMLAAQWMLIAHCMLIKNIFAEKIVKNPRKL